MVQWNGSKKNIAPACKIFYVQSLEKESMVLKKTPILQVCDQE